MAALDPYQPTGGRTEQAPDGPARTVVQATPLGPGPPGVVPPPATQLPRPIVPERADPTPGGRPPRTTTGRPILGRGSAILQREGEPQSRGELTSVALKNSPPWLISAAFHMLLLIVLGLLAMSIRDRDQIHLNVQPVYAEEFGEQLEYDSELGADTIDVAEDPAFSFSDLPEVENPLAAPPEVEIYPDGPFSTSDIDAPSIGLALTGREEGARKKALKGRYGATHLTSAAVRRGLEWLARNQLKDGSWSLSGPYRSALHSDLDNPVAATAMALLAFHGDGHTHRRGRFRPNVARGWQWLSKEQDADGNFFHHEGSFNHSFYTQGMCTIAICELYGMTKDPEYKEPAERAVAYCLRTQGTAGGWKYSPNSHSDLSVTGWVVMALQSAKMAGLDVPKEKLGRVEEFLDKVAAEGGSRYRYEPQREPSLAMTAEGLLCRQYLGWKRDDPRLVAGVEWITSPENLIDYNKGRDVYYWYYATQVAHHMEGDYWKRWNAVMRQVLPEQQIETGSEGGSWDPERPTMDQWAAYGGRLYVTCLSLYMLEVYYRHLPIYAKVYTDLLKSGRTDQR